MSQDVSYAGHALHAWFTLCDTLYAGSIAPCIATACIVIDPLVPGGSEHIHCATLFHVVDAVRTCTDAFRLCQPLSKRVAKQTEGFKNLEGLM
jgi:hypothetical protein